MKNIIFLLAGIIVIMLVGCGEGENLSSTTGASAQASTVNAPIQASSTVAPQDVGSFPSVPSIPEG